MTFDTGGGIVKRIQGGETFDVIVSPRPGMDGFVKDGKVIANTVTVIARSGIGVAVRKGSPNPIFRRPRCSSVRFWLQSTSPIRIPLAAHERYPLAKVLDRLGIATK
jgi:molybdate transport system substrate-binding protein